jgi:hypothetical protein
MPSVEQKEAFEEAINGGREDEINY